ncbi:mitochondrial tRNA-specific 2-thiouridylase 1 [Neocloeon triangulifer]|uniref:mitochondrial tRNA-specific 2-thiouridylase 1 n=1 Tax=Neocloeon triangulifer TaxID=2078957 RepID=UPI00286ECB16|nr:mitochondrial tRNA-specific 2-thiouridylase 1 [Neocloeon triangulifer]
MSGVLRRVVLGMSGGVDSAVSALLLKQKGFEVHGVFMKNWDGLEESGFCSGAKDAEDAEWVCKKLQIPFSHVNFVKDYWNSVFTDLLKDYSEGFTPNPDILCNRFVKFDLFRKHALENLGAQAFATGHYANTSHGNFLQNYSQNDDVRLLLPRDLVKDQTIFLSQVHRDHLRKVMFPLTHLWKSEVKRIAEESGLARIAKKDESMGMCFIGKRNFQNFIDEYLNPKCGQFVDITTFQPVGEHSGIHHYTIGQKCKLTGLPNRYFVVSKDVESQQILVAPGTNHPSLYSDLFFTSEPHWISPDCEELLKDGPLKCKFRYQNRHNLMECSVMRTLNNTLVVRTRTFLRALTPGQFAAFYKDGECLGSARIRSVGPSLYLQGMEFSEEVASTDTVMQSVRAFQ